MTIAVTTDSFSKNFFSIRYLTPWDSLFQPYSYSGVLKFYPENPAYLVDVSMYSDKDRLEETDIVVSIGTEHNREAEIKRLVEEKNDLIYEICKSSPEMQFTLDLNKMQVLERKHFTENLPVWGIHTFFIFSKINYDITYCIANYGKSFPDSHFYAWLLSYVYSAATCLAPQSEITDYSKQFLQALSCLASTHGNRKSMYIATSKAILTAPLLDTNNWMYDLPASAKRFEHLVEKAKNQVSKRKENKNDGIH